MKRRRFIIALGVATIAQPTPGASKIGAEEWKTGEQPHALLIFSEKVTAESYTGCSIRMYLDADVHRRYSFKNLAGQGFSGFDAENVIPIYF